jgi:hypothetical protein
MDVVDHDLFQRSNIFVPSIQARLSHRVRKRGAAAFAG